MTITLRESASDSSHDMLSVCDSRYLEIDFKQQLLSDYLSSHNYDAIILQQPWNFSWFTAGGNNQPQAGRCCAALYVAGDARVVLTNNVNSPWLFETQLSQLGFQLKERPWTQSLDLLVADVCRGRKVVSDTGVAGTRNVDREIQSLRLSRTAREAAMLREMGLNLAEAVERTAVKVQPGVSELVIAGGLINRMMQRSVEPISVQVWADNRAMRHRNAIPSEAKVKKMCTISAIGRRQGLMLAMTRTVCFGKPSLQFRKQYEIASLCQATARFFSQQNWEVEEVWNRTQRIYEKFHQADEWRNAEQGQILGYQPAELPIVPRSQFRLGSGMLVSWTPSVGAAQLGDTVLTGESGTQSELITKGRVWPLLRIEVKGEPVFVPDFVIR